MKCNTCGACMSAGVSDFPFKVSARTIVIIRDVPALQCDACAECLFEDEVMRRIDELLANVTDAVELEIVSYAA